MKKLHKIFIFICLISVRFVSADQIIPLSKLNSEQDKKKALTFVDDRLTKVLHNSTPYVVEQFKK